MNDTWEIRLSNCYRLFIQDKELETLAELVRDYTHKHPYDNTISDIYDTTQNVLQDFLEKQITEAMILRDDESEVDYNYLVCEDDETFLIFKILDKIKADI